VVGVGVPARDRVAIVVVRATEEQPLGLDHSASVVTVVVTVGRNPTDSLM
jgi:hypothetical protein